MTVYRPRAFYDRYQPEVSPRLGQRIYANATQLLRAMDNGQPVTLDDVAELCSLPPGMLAAIREDDEKREKREKRQ